MSQLDPAATIIEAFGGVEKVGEITGAYRSTVYRWAKPRLAGGTGGIVPHWHVPKLLAHARQHGIAVTEANFAPARSDQRSVA